MRTARKVLTVFSGGVPLFPFSDSFDTDGALGSRWTGSTWTISGGKAVNTPTLGAELISNGDAETGNPPTGWTQGGTPTTFIQSNEQAHGGTFSLKMITDQASEQAFSPAFSTTTGKWYFYSLWARPTAVVNERLGITRGSGAAGDNFLKSSPANTWTQHFAAYRETAGGAGAKIGVYTTAAAQTVYVDDASAKEIDIASSIATVETNRSDATIQAAISRGTLASLASQSGLALRVDSTSNPQNFLIAYINGTTAYLDQYKAGVITNLRNGAITYGADKVLKVTLSGTTAQLFYDNVQVGANATVDAAIVGTRHGLFSTTTNDTLDGFSVA